MLVLNDLSTLTLFKLNKCVVFAGLTAAKKMISTQWKPPRSLIVRAWILSFLDVIYLELSTARINGANEQTLDSWRSAAVTPLLLAFLFLYSWLSSSPCLVLCVCVCVCLCMFMYAFDYLFIFIFYFFIFFVIYCCFL